MSAAFLPKMKDFKLGAREFFARTKQYDETHNYTCDLCGREVFALERVCAQCKKALPWNDGVVCLLCGRKIKESGICLECKQKPLAVDRARSCFTHEKEAASLVLRFKRGAKYLYLTLTELTLPLLLREFPKADTLIGVPMTKKAEKKRGYNQSELLAKELARRSGKRFLAPAVKQKDTAQQKTLGRKEREENMKGSFHLTDRKSVKGAHILIIDDTMTTGATASELALVLKNAGAASVSLMTVTSVEKHDVFGKHEREKTRLFGKRK